MTVRACTPGYSAGSEGAGRSHSCRRQVLDTAQSDRSIWSENDCSPQTCCDMVVVRFMCWERQEVGIAEPKIVVWAHNSHVGDARFTDMGRKRSEVNVGQLMRERYGEPDVCRVPSYAFAIAPDASRFGHCVGGASIRVRAFAVCAPHLFIYVDVCCSWP